MSFKRSFHAFVTSTPASVAWELIHRSRVSLAHSLEFRVVVIVAKIAVVTHVLDAGRRQLMEHLGRLRPHASLALQ